MYYEEITIDRLYELASLYVDTFNSEPWNDKWTINTATKRLCQMINTEDSFGLCAYQDGVICGAF